jgi:2-furoate---CoA ligase
MLIHTLGDGDLHWACQFAGIIVTPLNWRVKPEELDYCLTDAEARAVTFEEAFLRSAQR